MIVRDTDGNHKYVCIISAMKNNVSETPGLKYMFISLKPTIKRMR